VCSLQQLFFKFRSGLAVFLLLSTSSCTETNRFHLLTQVEGAKLYQASLKNGNTAYLQTFDLRKIQIDQLMGRIEQVGKGKGLYYQGKGKSDSPFFKMQTATATAQNYQALYGDQVFSIINFSFFEDYTASSRLSFPIKLNGKVITGGSSPYGPIANPADPAYKTIHLKALLWDDRHVEIADYNPKTGSPLNQMRVQNAIVSYEHKDHPAHLLGGDPPNRYQVLGTFQQVTEEKMLAIISVNRATLEEAANLLRQSGLEVKDPIMTFDGGTSSYLFSAQQGRLLLPQAIGSKSEAVLPHYLGFRRKTSLH
jgi:hypothetical protein